MRYGILLGLFALVLISMSVFAASPVFTGVNTSSHDYLADKNYVALDSNFFSPIASDADNDLNELSCEVSYDAGFSWIKSVDYPTLIDFNTDTNKCRAYAAKSTGMINDLDVSFRIADDTFADALSAQRTWWVDNNGPATNYLVIQQDYSTHINFTITDIATTTGNGSGFKTMKYMINNTGVWNVGVFNEALEWNVPPQALGANRLTFWATDNLDNNTGLRYIDFNIRGVAPVFTGPITATREYKVAGDRNYYDFNNTWRSGVISDADADFNGYTCQVSFNDGFSWNAFLPIADFNTDTNKCQAVLDFEWEYTGWEYVKFRVSDATGSTTTSDDMNWYLDNTGPTTVGTFDGMTVITLTSTDSGTPAGSGSGVKRIYYSVDGAAWTNVAATTATVTVTTPGNHNIYFYATDNFDNNEMRQNGGDYRDKPFAVSGIDPTGTICNLTMLMMLVLVAAAIVSVLGLAYTGNLNITTATTVAISLMAFLIILAITGSINTVMCG